MVEIRRTAGDVWTHTACTGLFPVAAILAVAGLGAPASPGGRLLAVLAVMATVAVPVLVFLALRAEVVRLASDRIEKAGLFGGDLRRLDDILGARSGGDFIALISRGAPRPFIVPRFAFRDPAMAAWARALPNLDHQDDMAEMEAVEADARLGGSPEGRRETVAGLMRGARWLNLLAIGVCLWVMTFPRPYDVALLAVLILPALALGLLAWKRGGFTVRAEGAIAVRANLIPLLLGPSCALALRGVSDVQMLDWIPPLAVAVPVALVLMAAVGFADENARSRLTMLFLAPVLFAGAWGGLVVFNARLGDAPPEIAAITPVAVHAGDDPGVRVRLPPSMGGREIEVEVHRSTLAATEAGRPLCVLAFPGRFGWRSVAVAPCGPA